MSKFTGKSIVELNAMLATVTSVELPDYIAARDEAQAEENARATARKLYHMSVTASGKIKVQTGFGVKVGNIARWNYADTAEFVDAIVACSAWAESNLGKPFEVNEYVNGKKTEKKVMVKIDTRSRQERKEDFAKA